MQNIIVALIVAAAVLAAVYMLYKRFFIDDSPCDSCSTKSGCSSCELMELKKQADPEKLKQLNIQQQKHNKTGEYNK